MTNNEFKSAQLRLGLNNRQMAEMLFVTVGYVDMLRSGVRTPSQTIVRLIELEEKVRAK